MRLECGERRPRSAMTNIVTLDQIRPDDAALVGGKALSLGLMASSGLPVPSGFCVTTAAYRLRQGQPFPPGEDLACEIADAYRRLGGGLVAVRSSATTEDSAEASFAGQQETVL